VARANRPEVSAAAESVETRLSRVEEEIYQVRNRSPRDTLNYPIKLNNQLTFLMELVATGDAPPTDQSAAVFDELSRKLAGLRQQFDGIVRVDLARLNDRLRERNLEPVK
jgi:hypothetical protein